MTNGLHAVTVLVPGNLNPHALKRLEETFSLVRINKPDPALVTPDMAQSVRGVAEAAGAGACFIDALPKLEIVANFGVGYDAVDAGHAGARGVMVTNTPDVLTEEVADVAVGLLLSALREFFPAEQWLREGRWEREGPYPLTRGSLRGRKVGIFGMGRIGMAVAKRLEGFGAPIAYHNRRPKPDAPYQYHPTLLSLAGAVDTLVSVAPATPETEKAVNAEVLAALGPQGVFVNIGRGNTVDEEALAEALHTDTILAAGLDVFRDEPRVHPRLLTAPRATLLPHVGSASITTRTAMADLCVDNLVSWFSEGRALTPVPETAGVEGRQ
ncbi:MAG TPA: 2-hydroxyacid dehydrogenase [Mesorhizobium sp.]|jgi:lactate dehydrogenase-like 2-hydroxyacid dehydrogenase|nr:2-hydroxyacid dehydrogenase [Mesorhizobium sp.]